MDYNGLTIGISGLILYSFWCLLIIFNKKTKLYFTIKQH